MSYLTRVVSYGLTLLRGAGNFTSYFTGNAKYLVPRAGIKSLPTCAIDY
jgi:hypothetical protein